MINNEEHMTYVTKEKLGCLRKLPLINIYLLLNAQGNK